MKSCTSTRTGSAIRDIFQGRRHIGGCCRASTAGIRIAERYASKYETAVDAARDSGSVSASSSCRGEASTSVGDADSDFCSVSTIVLPPTFRLRKIRASADHGRQQHHRPKPPQPSLMGGATGRTTFSLNSPEQRLSATEALVAARD